MTDKSYITLFKLFINPFWNLITILIVTLSFSCQNENTEGKKIYDNHCLQCHQEAGKGVGKLIPPIDKDFLQVNSSQLGCIIKHGLNKEITVRGIKYNSNMPENDRLSDFDIVNLLNYMNVEFMDGSQSKFNIEQLRIDLKECIK